VVTCLRIGEFDAVAIIDIVKLDVADAVLDAVGDAIGAHVAKGEDWYYLRYAGVRPDCQGQGLGGLTIRAGIAEATAAGKPALLETATEGNVGIYLRLGFVVHEEWDVPAKDGPHFWSMSRPI
jgi:GNAT superfamily N-acetyltransferase